MVTLRKIARRQAIVLVVGGEYQGSVLDASVIWTSDDCETKSRKDLITIKTVDSKNAAWRCWNWVKKDIKWIPRVKLDNNRLFVDGVEDNVSNKVRKAIMEYDGAWVIRLKI